MWHDPASNVLVYNEPDNARILKHVAEAKQLFNGYVGVPATLSNMQILRLLGYPVVRPLERYDWPRSSHIKQPFHAQTETANFLAVHPRACVLSDMGTGKTLASLWAADALMRDAERRGRKLRCLVVAPLSTLSTVWSDALFQNFLGRRTAVVLHGSADKRLELLARPYDFYLLNHDGIKVGARLDSRRRVELGGFSAALANRADIQLVIIDEVGAFRDYRSLRSRVAKSLLSASRIVWLMTGTPTPNGPLDAYGIGKLLNSCHGEMFTSYRDRVMLRISQFKWHPRSGANAAAQALMQPSIRFKIEDCTDLPEMLTQLREVELSDEQRTLLKKIKQDLILELKKGTIPVANEAALRIKMMQIACGCVYDENHAGHQVDCRPRIKILNEIIEEAGSKVIIFAPFTSIVNMLNTALTDYSRRIILGHTPVKERTEIIQAFQGDRDPHILIAHPATISHGQTLTAAATTVWYGPTDKTDEYIQANKRMHRPGQKRMCTVVNLASTAVERETYRRLAANESLQGCLLKMLEGKNE